MNARVWMGSMVAALAAGALLAAGCPGDGKSKRVTFDTAGTFAYICEFHPFMKGTVVVQ